MPGVTAVLVLDNALQRYIVDYYSTLDHMTIIPINRLTQQAVSVASCDHCSKIVFICLPFTLSL